MYPIKIYTIDGVLIYQEDRGGSNTDKTPKGGIIAQGSPAESMETTIANPITFYGNWGAVINQDGHSRDLYNYYWASYSRGTDGSQYNPSWHNVYLDGYIPLRVKSIYDPCPYLYRIPSNGTYNQFTSNPGWTHYSYLGGNSWNMDTLGESWFSALGLRNGVSTIFEWTGGYGVSHSSIVSDKTCAYLNMINSGKTVYPNHDSFTQSPGYSVRCIERVNVTFVAPKGISMQQMCRQTMKRTTVRALVNFSQFRRARLRSPLCYRLCLCFA